MLPTVNNTVVAQGLGHFTSEYVQANAPQLNALTASYLSECQALETAIWGVITQRQLANLAAQTYPATNVLIDTVGNLIGQARLAFSDTGYLLMIALRIQINRSWGTTPQWSRFAATLLSFLGGSSADYIEGDAAFRLSLYDLTLPNEGGLDPIAAICGILADAVPNGVGGQLAYSTWADGNDFSFTSRADTAAGEAGFGSRYSAGTGGLLIALQGMV